MSVCLLLFSLDDSAASTDPTLTNVKLFVGESIGVMMEVKGIDRRNAQLQKSIIAEITQIKFRIHIHDVMVNNSY
jgi:hypothetical protein